MIQEGLIVAAIGMSTVFCFLTLTIFAVCLMAKVVGILNKYFPEAVAEPVKKLDNNNDAEIAVAIAVAKSLS